MKTNWEIKKLEEICEVFADGDWIEKKDQSISGIRLIQTGNIGNGSFLDKDEKARHLLENTFKRLRCTEVLPGDCLLSRLPDPVGRACLIPDINQKMITAVDCTIMRFKKNTLPKWFIYFSLSPDYQNEINKEVTGATRQRISRSNLGNIKIPLPPLSEQKRIVAILEEAFSAISKAKENAEKNLQNARELFESYLNSVFANPGEGWEEKKLGEVLEKTETVDPTKNPDKEFIYIDVSSVNKETLSIENTTLMKGKNAPSRARKLIKTNDIIFATVRPTLRRIAIIPKEYDDQVCSTGYFVLRAKKHLDNRLVFYFLLTNKFNERMEKLQKGASYPAVTDAEVREQIITYPILPKEQHSNVAKLDALYAGTKKLEAIYKQKLTNLEELKKSILELAFNGELIKDNIL